jgi:hypothetical protein
LMIIVVGLLPAVAFAKSGGQFSEVDMGKMMTQMQAMQKCMEQLDQAKIEALSARTEKEMEAVKAMCSAGKRDAAQEHAIHIGRQLMKEPEMQKMRKCGELMKGALPESVFEFDEKKLEKKHVCD